MYGLLGKSLKHSFSPQIHAMLGDYEYRLFEIEPEGLDAFFTNRKWDGVNVTIPYKKAVLPYLDACSSSAEKIGSVNTIVAGKDGKLTGYNTDYDGFLYLIKLSGVEVRNKKCLVLGTGGASLTVNAVLRDSGARQIINISRSGENNYNNIQRHYDADVIINTTPVGMYPNNLAAPLALDGFENLCGVLDIIYNPAKTKLIADAQARGIPAASGLSMLVAQAKRAAELFLNQNISDEKIKEIYNKLSFELTNIVLIGMPGSGKTTVGKTLAHILGRPLTDTDELIVRQHGKSIPEIFAEGGEGLFRRYEHNAVCEAGKQSGQIIATGGGVVVTPENRMPLQQNGTLVFLNRDVSVLPRTGRPLSQNADLHAMYCKRLPLYKDFCDFEIDGNASVREVADSIIRELTKQ